jgi:hypothetical protein
MGNSLSDETGGSLGRKSAPNRFAIVERGLSGSGRARCAGSALDVSLQEKPGAGSAAPSPVIIAVFLAAVQGEIGPRRCQGTLAPSQGPLRRRRCAPGFPAHQLVRDRVPRSWPVAPAPALLASFPSPLTATSWPVTAWPRGAPPHASSRWTFPAPHSKGFPHP